MNRNLGIIIFLLFISIVAMWIFPSVQESYKVRTIRTLLRQSARWALASQQDKSPLIALLHANYGAGYLSLNKSDNNRINRFINGLFNPYS